MRLLDDEKQLKSNLFMGKTPLKIKIYVSIDRKGRKGETLKQNKTK